MHGSLKIILLFCLDLIDIGKKYFNVNSLKVFEEISSDVIFNYLKDINIFCFIRNIYLVFILNCLNV